MLFASQTITKRLILEDGKDANNVGLYNRSAAYLQVRSQEGYLHLLYVFNF
jgi:hypothetical protein